MKLIPKVLVRTDVEGFEQMREIRNSCLNGMTHAKGYLTRVEQDRYRSLYPETVRHYLYFAPEGTEPIGFSRLALSSDGKHIVPTYGIAGWARGKGYAWDIVKHTMLAAGLPLKGDLLDSNEAIKRVDYALGWVPVGPVVNGVQAVECPWPPPFIDWERE